MNVKHLVDITDYSIDNWNEILKLAENIRKNPEDYSELLKNKIIGNLFFEPSTRTMLSFESAFIKLGGSTIGINDPKFSSISKGEDITDMIKVVSQYADIIVMRHSIEGVCKFCSEYSDVPLINGGDGRHLHPTQTFTDLFTIFCEKGRLNDLTVGFCGDLKNGRTVHSLVKGLSCYKNNKLIFISTESLKIPDYIKTFMKSKNVEFEEITSMSSYLKKLDILYMTRIQKERFVSEKEYLLQKDIYILNKDKLNLAKEDLKIMHPLPRIDEITRDVDDYKGAIYFKQAKYGVFVRMAIIIKLMDENFANKNFYNKNVIIANYSPLKCKNPVCITNNHSFCGNKTKISNGNKICYFCDNILK